MVSYSVWDSDEMLDDFRYDPARLRTASSSSPCEAYRR
jgi:hypothetical protein